MTVQACRDSSSARVRASSRRNVDSVRSSRPRSVPPTSRAIRSDSTMRSATGSARSSLSRSRHQPNARWRGSPRRSGGTPGAAARGRAARAASAPRAATARRERPRPGCRPRLATARAARRAGGGRAAAGQQRGAYPASAPNAIAITSEPDTAASRTKPTAAMPRQASTNRNGVTARRPARASVSPNRAAAAERVVERALDPTPRGDRQEQAEAKGQPEERAHQAAGCSKATTSNPARAKRSWCGGNPSARTERRRAAGTRPRSRPRPPRPARAPRRSPAPGGARRPRSRCARPGRCRTPRSGRRRRGRRSRRRAAAACTASSRPRGRCWRAGCTCPGRPEFRAMSRSRLSSWRTSPTTMPVRPHPQRLLDQAPQPDLARALEARLPGLHRDHVRQIESLSSNTSSQVITRSRAGIAARQAVEQRRLARPGCRRRRGRSGPRRPRPRGTAPPVR